MRNTIGNRLLQTVRREWTSLPQGEQLPGERELATRYGVSRPTIRKVIGALSREGVVYSLPGKGLYRGEADAAEAQALRGSHLALGLTDISLFNVDVVRAVVDEAAKHGMNVLTRRNSADVTEESRYLQDLAATPRLRGLLINPPLRLDHIEDLLPEYRRLNAAGVHLVIVNAPSVSLPLDHVCFDDAVGVAMLVRHLAELGHRRIAHVESSHVTVRSQSRRLGFERGMAALGLDCVGRLHANRDLSGFLSGHPADLLDAGATAIVAHNDDAAALVWRSLTERGLRVPVDASICGYDHLAHVDRGVPVTLTSASRDRLQLGRAAFGLLLNRLLEPAARTVAPRELVLPVQLVAGQTVGPPPKD